MSVREYNALASDAIAALADKSRFFALWRENNQLKQQLDAEREKTELEWEGRQAIITENQQLREQLAAAVEALKLCANTLRDKRIGTVDYMEGSRIYSDFRIAADKADAALAKIGKP